MRKDTNTAQRTIGTLRARVAELEEQVAAGQRFKAWVHNRMAQNGVPEDPDPEKREQTGCRVGTRFEWLEAKIRRLGADRDYAIAERNAARDMRDEVQEGCIELQQKVATLREALEWVVSIAPSHPDQRDEWVTRLARAREVLAATAPTDGDTR